MKKIYRKLTKAQIASGIIFTSTLSPHPTDDLEGLTTHVVYESDEDASQRIARLKDDRFFNNSHFKYNIIRS